MEEDNLTRLERELDATRRDDATPDLSLDKGSTLALHSMVRQQLVTQFHHFKLQAKLARAVENEQAAASFEEQAKTTVRQIAALDEETASLDRPIRILE